MSSAVYERRIPEQRVEGKPLGRHVKHDPRSRGFPAPKADAVMSVVHAPGDPTWFPLNQLQKGKCTAEALIGGRMLQPNVGGRGRFTDKDSDWLYANEQVEQGFTRDSDNGGTGIDVCKCAVAAKWITSYTHTFDLQSALQALTLMPGLMGCNWYTSADTPDANGVVTIAPDATVRGGHMFVACGIDTLASLVWFQQSWGSGWGVTWQGVPGRFAMSYDTITRLLSEQGDWTFPIR